MKDWALNLLLASIAVLAPIKAIMVVVGILLSADFITGLLKAHKTGQRITSKAMARSLYKMLAYQLLILTGFLMETYLLQDILPVTKMLAGVIGLVEFKSIAENVQRATGLDIRSITDKLQKRDDEPK